MPVQKFCVNFQAFILKEIPNLFFCSCFEYIKSNSEISDICL
jgi:hypothetical protein